MLWWNSRLYFRAVLSKLKLWYMERADGVNLVGRNEVENRQSTATTGKCWVQCRCGNEFFEEEEEEGRKQAHWLRHHTGGLAVQRDGSWFINSASSFLLYLALVTRASIWTVSELCYNPLFVEVRCWTVEGLLYLPGTNFVYWKVCN